MVSQNVDDKRVGTLVGPMRLSSLSIFETQMLARAVNKIQHIPFLLSPLKLAPLL